MLVLLNDRRLCNFVGFGHALSSIYPIIRELFHVYLNKCKFHFSRLHLNKISNVCFLLNNGRVLCIT